MLDEQSIQIALTSPAGFAHVSSDGMWKRAKHLDYLNRKIVEVAAGRLDYLIVSMPPRHGKPLHEDTLVLMDDGTRKALKNVKVGDKVITHKGRPRKVTNIFVQGERPSLKITTWSGREIISAFDHPFMTPSGWTNANDLEVGMCLAIPDGIELGKKTHWDEEFRLAGYFAGDGSTSYNHCGITVFDLIEQKDIIKCVKRLGFKYSKIYSERKKQVTGITIRGGSRKWLRKIGLWGKTSAYKDVPDFVFTGTNDQVRQYLGAYVACDGYLAKKKAKSARVEFYSISSSMLRNCQHLLMRFGINCLFRWRTAYSDKLGRDYEAGRLSLTSCDGAAKFANRIFPIHHKKGSLVKTWTFHRQVFDCEYLPDKIISIEEVGRKPCRCLNVSEDNTFIANDFVVHNSELISKYTPAWYVGLHPNRRVILTSYEADFASDWGFKARTLIEEWGPPLFGVDIDPDAASRSRWSLKVAGKGGKKLLGGMNTAGAGGPITGKGAHLFIIDDPIKNQEEALSETHRAHMIDWYRATARTRFEPGCGLILVMTRWHKFDLAGMMIEQLLTGSIDKKYEIVNFPAIADDDDVLGRKPGEALWPWRYPVKELKAVESETLDYWFSAMYQGDPIPEGGRLFKRLWFKVVTVAPSVICYVRFWDMGAGGDWTVGAKLGMTSDEKTIVADIVRAKTTPDEAEALVKQTSELDGSDVLIRMEQEPGQSGKAEIARFKKLLKDRDFDGVISRGKKVERYRPLAGQVEAGHVSILTASWNTEFLNEMEVVPSGKHDDQADASAGSYNVLAQLELNRDVVCF